MECGRRLLPAGESGPCTRLLWSVFPDGARHGPWQEYSHHGNQQVLDIRSVLGSFFCFLYALSTSLLAHHWSRIHSSRVEQ